MEQNNKNKILTVLSNEISTVKDKYNIEVECKNNDEIIKAAFDIIAKYKNENDKIDNQKFTREKKVFKNIQDIINNSN